MNKYEKASLKAMAKAAMENKMGFSAPLNRIVLLEGSFSGGFADYVMFEIRGITDHEYQAYYGWKDGYYGYHLTVTRYGSTPCEKYIF